MTQKTASIPASSSTPPSTPICDYLEFLQSKWTSVTLKDGTRVDGKTRVVEWIKGGFGTHEKHRYLTVDGGFRVLNVFQRILRWFGFYKETHLKSIVNVARREVVNLTNASKAIPEVFKAMVEKVESIYDRHLPRIDKEEFLQFSRAMKHLNQAKNTAEAKELYLDLIRPVYSWESLDELKKRLDQLNTIAKCVSNTRIHNRMKMRGVDIIGKIMKFGFDALTSVQSDQYLVDQILEGFKSAKIDESPKAQADKEKDSHYSSNGFAKDLTVGLHKDIDRNPIQTWDNGVYKQFNSGEGQKSYVEFCKIRDAAKFNSDIENRMLQMVPTQMNHAALMLTLQDKIQDPMGTEIYAGQWDRNTGHIPYMRQDENDQSLIHFILKAKYRMKPPVQYTDLYPTFEVNRVGYFEVDLAIDIKKSDQANGKPIISARVDRYEWQPLQNVADLQYK